MEKQNLKTMNKEIFVKMLVNKLTGIAKTPQEHGYQMCIIEVLKECVNYNDTESMPTNASLHNASFAQLGAAFGDNGAYGTWIELPESTRSNLAGTLACADSKLAAIKLFKDVTGLGLKQSKEIVDMYMTNINNVK